jgi:hypothetical protein
LLEPLVAGELHGIGDSSSVPAANVAPQGPPVSSRDDAANAAGSPAADAPQEGSSTRAEGWETW